MTTTTSSPSTVIAVAEPVFTNSEQLALAGFLAGYTGLTREAYALDLRQYANWSQRQHLRLFRARRADIECFARDLETKGRARATITRRLCTIAGFYKYAVEEELLDYSPAAHVRRPRLDYESHATGLEPARGPPQDRHAASKFVLAVIACECARSRSPRAMQSRATRCRARPAPTAVRRRRCPQHRAPQATRSLSPRRGLCRSY